MSRAINENILWNIEQIALFLAEAKEKPINQRSRYYKASFLFIASVIEALLFMIIKKYHSSHKIEYRCEYEYKQLCQLSNKLFKSTSGQIGIYDKKELDFELNEKIGLQSMNQIGFKYKLFDKRVYNKIDKIRRKRNRIHLQSLSEKDHRYTKRNVEYAASVLLKIINIPR